MDYIADIFDRFVPSGSTTWGTYTQTHAPFDSYDWSNRWSYPPGVFSVDGTRGIIGPVSRGVWGQRVRNDQDDQEVLADVAWSENATDATIAVGVVLRDDAVANDYVRCELIETTAGKLQVQLANVTAGLPALVGALKVADTYVPGTYWTIRVAAQGSQTRAKAWPTGTAEPDWQISGSTALSGGVPGHVGVRISNNTSRDDLVVSVQNFIVRDPITDPVPHLLTLGFEEFAAAALAAGSRVVPASDTLVTAWRDDDAFYTTGGRRATTIETIVTYTPPQPPPPPVAALPSLRLVACGRDGTAIAAPLANAGGRLIERMILAGGETPEPGHAAFTLPITDAANNLIYPGVTRLKVYLDGLLVFHGKIMVRRPILEADAERVEYEAYDMLDQLGALEIDPLLRGSVGWTDTLDALVGRLVDRVNSANLTDVGGVTGLIDIGEVTNPYQGAGELVMGDVAGSGYPSDTRHWDTGTSLLDALASLTGGAHGIEIIATPIEGQVAYDAYSGQYVEAITQLDVYPHAQAGVSQPDQILSYRGRAPTNLASAQYEQDARYVANIAFEAGATIGKRVRGGIAQDTASRRRYGTRHHYDDQGEQRSMQELVVLALATLEPEAPYTVTVTPAPNAPVAFRDYGLGDALPIQLAAPLDPATGRRTLDISVTARATSLSLALDENNVPTQSPLVFTSNAGTGRRPIPARDRHLIAHWRWLIRKLKLLGRKTPDAVSIVDDVGNEKIRIGRQDDGTITIREL